jgi:5-methylcytosine-specific restriction endonuclease McrA
MVSNNKRLREAIAREQGYKYICCWCGEWIPYGERTLEHVYPLSLGGTNARSNLRIACRDCNLGRGNRYDPTQFMYN